MSLNQEDASAFTSIDKAFQDLKINLDQVKTSSLREFIIKITSSIPSQELEGTIMLRKALYQQPFLIQEVIISNIIPKLLTLSKEKKEDFHIEVCWTLANIAAGNLSQTEFTIELSCIDYFNQIFESYPDNLELLYNVIWCIGNISAESDQLRNVIVNSRLFNHVLQFVDVCIYRKIQRYFQNSMWVLGNLLGIRENLDLNSQDRILIIITKVLYITKDDSVLEEIVYDLSIIVKTIVNAEYFSIKIFKKLSNYCARTQICKRNKVLNFFKCFVKRIQAGWHYFQDEKLFRSLKKIALKTKLQNSKILFKFLAYFFTDNSQSIKKLLDLKFFSDLQASLRYNMKKVPEKISFFICSALAHSDTESFIELKKLEYIDKLFTISLLVKRRKYLENIMNTFQTIASKQDENLINNYSKKVAMFAKHCRKNGIEIVGI